uniref:Uncharacterized protein n=2 Tax=Eutreptiella gymnastica TaxID=73025 RepID=A0A7S1I1X1_9EUGL|mmetsp:Transcript_122562/g.212520  ORF Transcript_122562/g.212520 Transcript_122562/m.212520 type:complete len:850 (+) Transcript_122562:23-2572(+)
MSDEYLQTLDGIICALQPRLRTPEFHDSQQGRQRLLVQCEQLRLALLKKDADVVKCVEMGQQLLAANAELKAELAEAHQQIERQMKELRTAQDVIQEHRVEISKMKSERLVLLEEVEDCQQTIELYCKDMTQLRHFHQCETDAIVLQTHLTSMKNLMAWEESVGLYAKVRESRRHKTMLDRKDLEIHALRKELEALKSVVPARKLPTADSFSPLSYPTSPLSNSKSSSRPQLHLHRQPRGHHSPFQLWNLAVNMSTQLYDSHATSISLGPVLCREMQQYFGGATLEQLRQGGHNVVLVLERVLVRASGSFPASEGPPIIGGALSLSSLHGTDGAGAMILDFGCSGEEGPNGRNWLIPDRTQTLFSRCSAPDGRLSPDHKLRYDECGREYDHTRGLLELCDLVEGGMGVFDPAIAFSPIPPDDISFGRVYGIDRFGRRQAHPMAMPTQTDPTSTLNPVLIPTPTPATALAARGLNTNPQRVQVSELNPDLDVDDCTAGDTSNGCESSTSTAGHPDPDQPLRRENKEAYAPPCTQYWGMDSPVAQGLLFDYTFYSSMKQMYGPSSIIFLARPQSASTDDEADNVDCFSTARSSSSSAVDLSTRSSPLPPRGSQQHQGGHQGRHQTGNRECRSNYGSVRGGGQDRERCYEVGSGYGGGQKDGDGTGGQDGDTCRWSPRELNQESRPQFTHGVGVNPGPTADTDPPASVLKCVITPSCSNPNPSPTLERVTWMPAVSDPVKYHLQKALQTHLQELLRYSASSMIHNFSSTCLTLKRNWDGSGGTTCDVNLQFTVVFSSVPTTQLWDVPQASDSLHPIKELSWEDASANAIGGMMGSVIQNEGVIHPDAQCVVT